MKRVEPIVRADAILNLAFERTNGDVNECGLPATGYSPLTRGGLWASDDLPDSCDGSALDQIGEHSRRGRFVRSVFRSSGLDAALSIHRGPGCAEF